ncbi:hypothetical protein WICMUC_003126 [Wickerhamomyces mucosus]|uniref:Enolase-phosphatase E1 n=1 Tax=Wickerhamomyces mucosus TaxID=1378264 RepID=A0A9P8PNE6_9ASCO|nr:hypothetical protein WICMUC_003126 [Wickerhamomyces mucosus]
MASIQFSTPINAIILDIEGTIAPITFVKDVLFPYFLKTVPKTLSQLKYPISSSSQDPIELIVSNFSETITQSQESLTNHINDLVSKDIKDSTLKSLQGYIWQEGYESGELKAPIYADGISNLKKWTSKGKKVYIYSSGSIKAQKLLFKYVDINNETHDLNGYLSGYFDITTSGFKFEPSSYSNILKDIAFNPDETLFLSDNVKEVKAALDNNINSLIVIREGNAPLSDEDLKVSKTITSFYQLDI